ncbi:hypothetical protein L1077_27110 [Pseudoalteromonas luteoviolacea]|uniref:Class I lanthipeptide n=1 Tax=Pseudoalteromonas luteoviolacea H33 TaxID=1365251 RepID=A0A167BK63_9GAMM|nr:hypothetical protein [Pseudoalteromonas luteoviolacea]KZN46636.1 hypothetical protein N476_24100 [Pseudoalteromonas luteoviolacea H33]KZN76827.1 hypothetical protein N477_01395 [Pseudoalteromonas luteoviolacea H33-S]MBQ4880268.1 hypothetical protein [Pseudoalteromonas luteoviolacea]MBQ4909351.1 hypothetical protein [Pseudoalteromonas luteoviolacea]MCF6443097.1 hypothetical protein [Pseudoalteromonas luteoviolacea]
MNIKLNKKKIKTLSADKKVIPQEQTADVGGGAMSHVIVCFTYSFGGCCGTVVPTGIGCTQGCEH